jgi:hypothetical protein
MKKEIGNRKNKAVEPTIQLPYQLILAETATRLKIDRDIRVRRADFQD